MKALKDSDAAMRLLSTYGQPTAMGCFEWRGGRSTYGYGRVRFEKQQWFTHRLAYEAVLGAIPEGLCVLHRCDNPACFNPEHLFLGTKGDNNRDRAAKNRNADRRGERGPTARLTEAQVRSIRQRYAMGGISQRALAEEFGVCQPHISDIVRGERWLHVVP